MGATRERLSGADGEIADGDDLLRLQVGQKGPPGTDAPIERQEVPDVEGPPRVVALARRRPRHGLEVAQIRRSRRAGRYELLVLVALLDQLHGGLGIARRDG